MYIELFAYKIANEIKFADLECTLWHLYKEVYPGLSQ